MLKADKQAFLELISGDQQKVAGALSVFRSREKGHFEHHPVSAKLVREHLSALVELWNENLVEGCREWVAQLVADARAVDGRVKPIVISSLNDQDCSFLPTLLYMVGSQPTLFEDVGPQLQVLAGHSDPQVRWRVAWAISKMKSADAAMRSAIDILRHDSHPTTQTYVRAARV